MENLKEPRGYAEDFDADWYLETYVKPLKQQVGNKGIHAFAMDCLHEIFCTGKYGGEKLLDIGTGPSVYSVISASRHVQEIHLSDINARNREILQTWRDGTNSCREIFDYICEKEGEGQSVNSRSDEVRKKVTDIFEFDLREPESLEGAQNSYDIITASLLLCAIAVTETEYTDLLKKVKSLLKPNGYLVVVGVFGGTVYKVGDFKFPAPKIDRGKMKGLYLKEDFKILYWRETEPENYHQNYKDIFSNEEGVFTLICQKS